MASAESAESTFGCAICANGFKVDDQQTICTIPCGHVYHENCLKQWFHTQIRQNLASSCPKCRATAHEAQIIRLYLHETVSYPEASNGEMGAEVAANNGDGAAARTVYRDEIEYDLDLQMIQIILSQSFSYSRSVYRDNLIGLDRHLDRLGGDLSEMQLNHSRLLDELESDAIIDAIIPQH